MTSQSSATEEHSPRPIAAGGPPTETGAPPPAPSVGSNGPDPSIPPPAPRSEGSGDSETSAAATAEPPKRRVRLNPTYDPQQLKPIPSVSPGTMPAAESAAPAPASAPAATVPAPQPKQTEPDPAEVDADEPAAAGKSAPEPAVPAPPAVDIPLQQDLDSEMEAEIAAALASGEIGMVESIPVEPTEEAAADGSPAPAASVETLSEGAKISGKIQSIHEDNVFIDFGMRMSGVVSLRQFSSGKPPVIGNTLRVVVSKVDEDEGLIACHLPRAASRISGDWHALATGQVVDCMVSKTNKGGLDVNVGTLRGFMPASQVELGYVADLEPFVGQKLRARVTEVNPGRRRLVLSRKSLLQEERAVAEKELLTELEAGQTRTGVVKTIKDYGAFVDLGGIDGFLHIGQMSWVRINHPSEILAEGQSIEVKVLTIDPGTKKVSLGMRQLTSNPWTSVENKYPKGSTVSGKVTRTEPFGAFVELEPGVEGLVHISELDYRRVKNVTEVLHVGQTTQAQVLEVDPGRKRISLSVKALKAAPESEAPAAAVPDPAHERKRKSDLKGGIGGNAPGGLFGDPNSFG